MLQKINQRIEAKQAELKEIYAELGRKVCNGETVEIDSIQNKARIVEGHLDGLEEAADILMEGVNAKNLIEEMQTLSSTLEIEIENLIDEKNRLEENIEDLENQLDNEDVNSANFLKKLEGELFFVYNKFLCNNKTEMAEFCRKIIDCIKNEKVDSYSLLN